MMDMVVYVVSSGSWGYYTTGVVGCGEQGAACECLMCVPVLVIVSVSMSECIGMCVIKDSPTGEMCVALTTW